MIDADEDFAEFVRSVQPELLRFGLLLTGSPHEAADLTQDALVRVGLRWRRVAQLEHPRAYVRRTMTNLHTSRWRRLHREVLSRQPVAREDGVLDPVPLSEQPLWAVLAELPARQRAVLVLRYYEDLSEAEIADVLGCAPGTVKSQASRALATLRTRLDAVPTQPDPTMRRTP